MLVRVVGALVVTFVLFATIRMFAGPAPSTMNKEWQEATNEYLRVCALLFYLIFQSACASRREGDQFIGWLGETRQLT